MSDQLMKVEDIQDALSISRRSVFRLIEDGTLPSFTLPGRRRRYVRRRDFDALIDAAARAARPSAPRPEAATRIAGMVRRQDTRRN